MSRDPDYLYQLLPQVQRSRDALQGYPLRALLRIVGEQVKLIEDDIQGLYDNWFIETCDDFVVPYIGDLIGFRPVPEALSASFGTVRREVANTVALRRRKGTLALLETLALDVAGWPARAVQFYTLLGWTQHLNHVRPGRGRTVDLRAGDALAHLDGPFDQLAHTVGLRGRYNIADIGLFVWRLKAYSVTHAAARCIKLSGGYGESYTFSELGNDTPLYTRPTLATDAGEIAGETTLPVPVRRRAFELRRTDGSVQADPAYYGAQASLSIVVQDWPCRGEHRMLAADEIIPADLSDWQAYAAPLGRVLVDPERGRIVFPSMQLPKRVWVSYHTGFSADMGGGEYPRSLVQPEGALVYRVHKQAGDGEFASVALALEQWNHDKRIPDPQTQAIARAGVIEIADSGVYREALAFSLDAGESLQVRAASMARPTLRLLDYHSDKPDQICISGAAGSRFRLDGLLVAGCGIEISGQHASAHCAPSQAGLCDVMIRHCTLVPGWELDCACTPQWESEPSIMLRMSGATLRIEHSIVGPLRVLGDSTRNDPSVLQISDSIVDAGHETGTAVGDERCGPAFVTLSIARSTVIGVVLVHALGLAENTIFVGPLRVARRQIGCVRYSYVAPDSRTPQRYHCQPDLAAHVRPRFNSLRYGTPQYCQLALDCPVEINRGADDESEMGAFHDLYQPQRAAGLAARLNEYTPAGMQATIIYAS